MDQGDVGWIPGTGWESAVGRYYDREAGELAEHVLWKTEDGADEMAGDPARRTAIADELADVTIFPPLLAHHYGIDLGEAVVVKPELGCNCRVETATSP